jgi:hypothetical protein
MQAGQDAGCRQGRMQDTRQDRQDAGRAGCRQGRMQDAGQDAGYQAGQAGQDIRHTIAQIDADLAKHLTNLNLSHH